VGLFCKIAVGVILFFSVLALLNMQLQSARARNAKQPDSKPSAQTKPRAETQKKKSKAVVSNRKEDWTKVFFPLAGKTSPPVDAYGFYPIDTVTQDLLDDLRVDAPQIADEIAGRLQKNPIDPLGRLDFCVDLERNYRSVNRSSRSERFLSLFQCYQRGMDVFAYVDTLSSNDPLRKKLLPMTGFCAMAAGERVLAYSEGLPERLEVASKMLYQGVGKGWRGTGKWCRPPKFCYEGYGLLLLALRLQGAPQSKLEAVFDESKQVPGIVNTWADIMSVHRQLPGIRTKAFWDTLDIPWLSKLEEQWWDIRYELNNFMDWVRMQTGGSRLLPEQPTGSYLTEERQWNSATLFVDGKNETGVSACEALPRTCSLLQGHPELKPENYKPPAGVLPEGEAPPSTLVGLYQLLPGAKLRPHFGKHSMLVATLGLYAPQGNAIRVGNERRSWVEGSWVFFDDSFEREFINDAAETLYYLEVVMLHPDVCADCGEEL